MFSNWMLQSKDSIRKNFKNLTISLKRATCFNTKASRGNLAPQSPRGNMHKLSDCIRTPLKRFLACLTFHRKKIRLRHLHKRTSTESAPVIVMRTTVYHMIEKMIWSTWLQVAFVDVEPAVKTANGLLY